MFFPSLYTTPDHISEGREGHCHAGVVLHSHFLRSQAEEWTTRTVEWRHQGARASLGSAHTIIPRCCDAHCTATRLYGHTPIDQFWLTFIDNQHAFGVPIHSQLPSPLSVEE